MSPLPASCAARHPEPCRAPQVAVAILASFFFFAFAMVQKPMLHAPLDVVKVCAPAPRHPPLTFLLPPASSPVPLGPWLRLPSPAS